MKRWALPRMVVTAAVILATPAAWSAETDGVSDTTIKIGQTTALDGPAAVNGVAISHGIQAYIEAVNRAGGIAGRKIELIVRDDGYEPSRTIREMVTASVDVVVQAARLRDGSRRITHITEVLGMEGDVIITQDLFIYDLVGEDAHGNIVGRHRSTGIGRPRFWERARYFGEEQRLATALDAAEVRVETAEK